MHTAYLKLLMIPLLVLACSPPASGQTNFTVSIVSLKDHLPELFEEASKWYSDAYLVYADIPIQTDNQRPWLISAAFQSPSTDTESISVRLLMDGSMTIDRISHITPVNQLEPILENDWLQDSPEALSSLVDEAVMQFLQINWQQQCSFLKLERYLSQLERPVVWRLTLSDCGVSPSKYSYLDPLSGEMLDLH